MSVPKIIMIDTVIFDEAAYNFESEKMRAFIDSAKENDITLLLPDPINREIKRHIEQSANEVVKALEKAKRRAPFLRKWKEWPVKQTGSMLNWELRKMARDEWEQFLKNFTVVKLDYSGIKIDHVMNWYDRQQAPFGDGAKRKEFPDAFAFAIILNYVNKNKCNVAIISKDLDFKKAADKYPKILHFDSLPAFTQALISSDTRVESVSKALEANINILEKAIANEFPNLGFYHHEDDAGDVEDVEVENLEIDDLKVIGIGEKQCIVAFEAKVEYSAYVRYEKPYDAYNGYDYFTEMLKRDGTVGDFTELSGTAKLSISDDWMTITDINLISFDDDEIEVYAEPDEY